MMGISRTRSAGAKVAEHECAQLEALAQTRGLTLGEWCRDVLLAQLKPSVASLSEETILAEILGLRMIMINLLRALGSSTSRRSSHAPFPATEHIKGNLAIRRGLATLGTGVAIFASLLLCKNQRSRCRVVVCDHDGFSYT